MRWIAASLLLVLCAWTPVFGDAPGADDPMVKARSLLHTERHEEAVRLLRKIIEQGLAGKPDAEGLVKVGQAQWLLDEDEEAVKTIERAVELDPKDVWVRGWLGRVLETVDKQRAANAYREAVEVDPEYGYAWFRLAKLLSRLREDEEGLQAILQAIEHGETHADAHFYAGLLLARGDRIAESVAQYRKAIEVSPEYANAHYNLGGQLFEQGKHEEALASWERAAALDREDIWAHAKVLRALTALGRHAEAIEWREKVYAIYDATEDPRVKKMRMVTIDEFEVDGAEVTVREVIRREKLQLYTTIFYVSAPEDVKFRINLEPHGAAFLGGPKFVLGRNNGPKHTTYKMTWDERPTYPVLKKAVIRAIRDELDVASSSNAKTGTVEVDPN